MRDLKITIGLLGIILFIAGAVVNFLIFLTYLKKKKDGIRNVAIYLKTNPDKKRTAKIGSYIGTIGFWLMIAAMYIKD